MKRRTHLKRFGALFALLLCFGMLYVLTHTATKAAPPDLDGDKDSTLEESKFQFEQVDVDSVTDLSKESAIYIVRLQDPPLSSYRGGIRGLAGTSPAATGKRKVDARSSQSVAYLNYLDQKRAQAIDEVSRELGRSIEVVYEYKASLNGFAANMTAAEAARVAKLPSVQHIEPDMEFELHTDAGPAWLGAPAVWGQNPQELAFEADLSGLNEVPPVTDTMASGMGKFSYNAMTHELRYDIEVSAIMSITKAHIHSGAVGVNGPSLHWLYDATGANGPGGDFDPDHPISGMVTLSPDEHQALMNGDLYVNVHTVAHGPGEIRGQIMQVHRVPFNSHLSGLNEVPPVTDTMASGMGRFSYNAMTHELDYHIEVSDIMSITAAHIHQAPAGANGGAIHTLYNGTGDFGPDHPISGMVTLSPDQHEALMNGDLYVNVHTASHGPGEIRGQIMPVHTVAFDSDLSGLNEVPPVTDTMASGMGMFSYNAMTHELHYRVEVSDIMSITKAHIHRGTEGVNGPSLHWLYDATGANGPGGDFDPDHPISGMVTLSPDEHRALMNGDLYVNVHTASHGPGEIRGQIMQANYFHAVPFNSHLSGANEVPPVTDTMASGMGSFSYDVKSGELDYYIGVSNIMSITKAHIHSGTMGVNGPSLYWLYDATGTNGPGGEFGPDDPIHGTIMVSDEHKAQLWNGALYVNIHTTNHPSGELRGQIKMNGTMGEGVIVGVIDTGIDPWNPSFADVGGDGYDHTNPRGEGNYVGVCNTENISPTTGEITPFDGTFPCNDKLIGAWGYGSVNEGTPRDSNGHGSHTAGTAAGNVVINPSIETPSATFTATVISGVAPHANVIAYAACCTGSALAAARDQVVLDGVDVVNYSIGAGAATPDPWNSSFAQQWLNVRDAGIFVATSAGNAGPGDATVGSPGDLPWMTTVGASSHNRAFLNSVIVDGGALELHGLGMTGPLTTAAEIVLSSGYAITSTEDARLCAPDAFPAGTFTGQIVVCERGAYGRVAKGQSVAAGGAGGYILAQPDEFGGGPGSVAADAHVIPGVHIDYYTYQELRAYITATAGTPVMGTITGGALDINDSHADVMASFSSRGPNRGMLPDLIVPNVTAPGRSIWAAYHQGEEDGDYTYNVIQGTSMSSPHVAGAGALMVAEHPNWTPAQIESALMTTARDTILNDDGVNVATPFAQGSGHVDLRAAPHAGLVLDVTTDEFQAANPNEGGDAKTLNIASMGDSQCLGVCSWNRTVSSTLEMTQTWSAMVMVADGVTMTGMVDPMTFMLPAGATQELTITVDVRQLPVDEWAFAKVMLTPISPTHPVPAAHLPIAVNPTAAILPLSLEIDTRRNAGSVPIEAIRAMEITDLNVEVMGLTEPDVVEFEINEDPTKDIPSGFYDDLSQVFWMTMTVPADTYTLIAEVLASESPDLDMAVGMDSDGDGQPDASEEVCVSAGGSWTEFCEVPSPDAGLWWVIVLNWDESANAPDAVALATAIVPNADNGNASVHAPDAVPAGEEFDLRVFWDEPDMEAGDRLYGAIRLGSDGTNAGNLGTIPVYLNRHPDNVTKHAPPDVLAGESMTYTIMVHPNVTDEELNYMLTDTIPAGTTYVEGSASASAGTVTVENEVLTWSGTQIAPSRRYIVSTSLDNPSCGMPLANSGAYVNLEAFNIFADPTVSGPGPWVDSYDGGPYAFFNDPTGTDLFFTDEGYVSLDISSVFGGPYANAPIPTAGLPEALLAMIWGNDMDIVYEEGTGENNRGVTTGVRLTTGGVPSAKLLEFDGIQMAGDPTSQIDFEMMIRERIADDPGFYEIIFAYDNLTGDFTNLTVGTIGVENHDGTQGTQYAHNDANLLTLQNGMAICFDWAVPQDLVEISFEVTVDQDASDVTTNTVHHNTDNPGSMEESASAYTWIGDLEIEFSKTVGTEPGVCATSNEITVLEGTDVYYCYTVANTSQSDVTFPRHDLHDTELGSLLSGFEFDLAPGMSVSTVDAGLTISTTMTRDTVNMGTWTAHMNENISVQRSDVAVVNVVAPDQDGISDETEAGAPNNGDGNGDGIPDSGQNNVTSLPNVGSGDDEGYVTLESPPGTDLVGLSVMTVPMTISMPSGVQSLPQGIFDFEVRGVSTDTTIMLTITLHADSSGVDSYWKLDGNDQWYNFAFSDTTRTGAVITHEMSKTLITLHLKDGAWGDDDGTVNGTILDPGAPAMSEVTAISLASLEGQPATLWQTLWIALLLLIGVSSAGYFYARRRKRA